MVSHIKIKWLPEIDKTQITFAEEWHELERIEKMDVLQDAIGDLTEIYNRILREKPQSSGDSRKINIENKPHPHEQQARAVYRGDITG